MNSVRVYERFDLPSVTVYGLLLSRHHTGKEIAFIGIGFQISCINWLLKMAWRDAYDYCRFNGKSLVSIESAFKAEELKLHLRSLIPAGISSQNL